MIGLCNMSLVEEFYANALAYGENDYTSYVWGVENSYAPEVIDGVFGFREEDYCGVRLWRAAAWNGTMTDEEYANMLHELVMPGIDWRYTNQGARARLQATEMMSVAKAWAKLVY
jgi:hypothetical protein